MDARRLDETARALLADDRGLLAMDESTGTCNKRFAALGIPQTVEMRRAWRDLIVTTPGLGASIGGAILYDETIRQQTRAGVPFAQALEAAGIVPGIKVDAGSKALAGFDGEEVTEGLDGLRERLAEYAAMGARFTKWRAVVRIGAAMPSAGALLATAHALARYAALAQEAGLVPIVEPEVLMDGDHSLERCRAVTDDTLRIVFDQLAALRVRLEGMLLKPNMVLPGNGCADQADTAAIVAATVETFRRRVPAAVAGIAFLSGGQGPALASERLNAMNALRAASAASAANGANAASAMNAADATRATNATNATSTTNATAGADARPLPWPLAFSYARAIQDPAMAAWRGVDANLPAAQRALAHRAACNRAARAGRYDAAADAPR